LSHFFRKIAAKGEAAEGSREREARRAQALYEGCTASQKTVLESAAKGYQYLSVRCPRRSGKSHGMTSLALWWGETHPNSRILIISLTLKSTKENFWSGAPGGIIRQNTTYELGLKFNHTDTVWLHENGSRGRLAGAETVADIERLRGAAAEADIAIVDECKSFAPELLNELIRDVLEPGLMTRNGTLILGGTPGSIPVGTFYEATDPRARNDAGGITCIPVEDAEGPAYDHLSKDERSQLWRLHTWTIQDNTAAPMQWKRALGNKRRQGWGDDHPTWRREYLGEWVTDATDLVYTWAAHKHKEEYVTWRPEKKTKDNPAGLPIEQGPWRFVLGVDLGYVDESALVLAAYSETSKELRHVYDFKQPGMTVDDFFDEVFSVIERYGRPDAIVADTAGGGSKMLVETLNQRYGLGIESAKKTEKQDHIELLNSDFAAGRVKVIPGSDLAHELSGLQWDLSRESKMVLARTGRLREDPSCPNHLCDALLYLYRYSYHFWSQAPKPGLTPHTTEWWVEFERRQLAQALKRRKEGRVDPHGLVSWSKGGDPWKH
jgi:hypothetical protein